MSISATITADFAHVALRGRLWSETFPIDRLPAKIAFYEGLRDRKGGAYAEHYEPTVRALRRAQKVHTILNGEKETTP